MAVCSVQAATRLFAKDCSRLSNKLTGSCGGIYQCLSVDNSMDYFIGPLSRNSFWKENFLNGDQEVYALPNNKKKEKMRRSWLDCLHNSLDSNLSTPTNVGVQTLVCLLLILAPFFSALCLCAFVALQHSYLTVIFSAFTAISARSSSTLDGVFNGGRK